MYIMYICVYMYMHVCLLELKVLSLEWLEYRVTVFLYAILSFLPCLCMCILELGLDFRFPVQKNKKWGPLLKGSLRASGYKNHTIKSGTDVSKETGVSSCHCYMFVKLGCHREHSRTSASNSCSHNCFLPTYHRLTKEPDANFMLRSGTSQLFGYACQFGEGR